MSARQNLLSTPRQLSLVLDPTKLETMTQAERNAAIARLAGLLMEAAEPTRRRVQMSASDALPVALLERKAVVYIRQSTQAQIQTHTESRRRQYELVDVARARG